VPFYLAIGDTDFLKAGGDATMAWVKQTGVKNFYVQSTSGHTWLNWKRYLYQTLPLMFKNTSGCK
jgi:enterochelin esterase-like enzyme